MDHNIKAFEQWANDEGYDVANTYDTERYKWIWLNPMTADLWRAYEAALSQSTQSVSEPVAQQEPVSPAQEMTDSEKDAARYLYVNSITREMLLVWVDSYDRADAAIDAAMQGDAK